MKTYQIKMKAIGYRPEDTNGGRSHADSRQVGGLGSPNQADDLSSKCQQPIALLQVYSILPLALPVPLFKFFNLNLSRYSYMFSRLELSWNMF